MNGRDKRRKRARRAKGQSTSLCFNCGEMGSHYAPPSLGEPGFFTCEFKP